MQPWLKIVPRNSEKKATPLDVTFRFDVQLSLNDNC